MNELIQAWDLKTLQELRTLYTHLTAHKKTMQEFVAFMDSINKAVIKKCPTCSEVMDLYSVNSSSGDMVGGDYKSQWYCRKCGYSIFSIKSPNEEWKEAQKE